MKPLDDFQVMGHCRWWLYNEKMELKQFGEEHNTITNAGLSVIANRMSGTVNKNAPSHVAVGTGTQSNPQTATALQSEISRVAVTSNTQSNNLINIKATFDPGVGTGNLTEKGILNANSSGDLIAYNTFSVTKSENDTLVLEWDITFSRSS